MRSLPTAVSAALVATALLVACAGVRAPDCSAAGIWTAESAGGEAECADAGLDDEAASARYLARQHAVLAERLAELEGRRELAGRERLERVELIREIEQIVGVASVRGWRSGTAQALDQGRQKQ